MIRIPGTEGLRIPARSGDFVDIEIAVSRSG
jgi:hypothetical protein